MSSIFHKGYWIALALAIVVSAGYAYHRDLPERFLYYRQSEDAVQQLRDDLDEARAEEKALKDRVDGAAGQDPFEVEATARSGGHVREDETIYRIEFVEPGADGSER